MDAFLKHTFILAQYDLWGFFFFYNIALAGNIWCFGSKGYQWSHSVMSDILRPNPPGWNTGVDSCSFLQGIFPTQGSNPGLLHCGQIFYQLSHKGSPRILEWATHPFSSGSPRPRNWTRLSCVAGRIFTSWATRETMKSIAITIEKPGCMYVCVCVCACACIYIYKCSKCYIKYVSIYTYFRCLQIQRTFLIAIVL